MCDIAIVIYFLRINIDLFFNLDSKTFFDESFRDEYMKPGFENFADAAAVKPSADVDLDGEIYGEFIFMTSINKILVLFLPWFGIK